MAADKKEAEVTPFITLPVVGTGLTVASGICFLVLGMILPLVGRAAKLTTFYDKNKMAFLAVAILSLVLAGLAIYSKMKRRHLDNSPLPFFSILIFGLSGILLVAFLGGFLAI